MKNFNFLSENFFLENKNKFLVLALSVVLLGFMFGFPFLYIYNENKENEANYNWSYEKACENGDFEVAHNILAKLQDDVLSEKSREKNHQIKKEVKSHWFKDDEIVVDSVSILDHEQYIQGLQDKGRIYLAGLDYVYNAEIAYVKETNEDDSSAKVKYLLSELRSKLLIFKSLDMEEEAQDVYERLTQKVDLAKDDGEYEEQVEDDGLKD